jgi:uncharacterized membrane protein
VAWVGSSVLIGAATGLRSSSGIAALSLVRPSDRLSPLLRRRWVRAGSVLVAGGELVVDKLPSTPARTGLGGLVPRVVLGAVAAGQLSRGSGSPPAVAGLLGSAAAVGTAFGGLALRRRLSERLSPIPAALIEDALCAALAGGAVWLSERAVASSVDDPDDADDAVGPSTFDVTDERVGRDKAGYDRPRRRVVPG